MTLVLAAATGCGAHDGSVPFRPLPSSKPWRLSVPPGARPCAPPHARLRKDEGQGLPTAQYYDIVTVVNRGRRACFLDATLDVRLPATTPAPVTVEFVADPFGEFSQPSPAKVAVLPGRSASAALIVSHLCRNPLRDTRTVRYRVSLPRFAALNESASACSDIGTRITVGAFWSISPPRPGSSHWPLVARLRVPKEAHGGETFRFEVDLTNTSEDSFHFPYCPDYELTGISEAHLYTLNCAHVGELQPGATVRFALESRVPRTDHRWRSQLSFSTGPDGDHQVIDAATSVLVVP